VADAEAVEDAASRVESELGPIDVWVNNAMVSVFSPIRKMTAAEFKRVMEVTYLGYVHGTLAALRRMWPRDRGTIVQVGSALAYRSIPLQSAYCAAKHAILGFTESLRCELIHDRSRVHVTAVHMPAVNTPQFSWVKSRLPRKAQPVPPIFQPEVAADAIYFAARHRRRELWVGGPTVKAIIADKIAPGLVDRYLARTGYASQQTNEPVVPRRLDNLWKPVDDEGRGDFGAHGAFDHRAYDHSTALALTKARPFLQAAAVGCVGLVAGVAVRHMMHAGIRRQRAPSTHRANEDARHLATLAHRQRGALWAKHDRAVTKAISNGPVMVGNRCVRCLPDRRRPGIQRRGRGRRHDLACVVRNFPTHRDCAVCARSARHPSGDIASGGF
jgi:NAD(P)-dependent dehydrogenase (short-subunit alcohol dehydrogenase family)